MRIFILLVCYFLVSTAYAETPAAVPVKNYFGIDLYKPTYVLPYYYTVSPYNAVYANNTPGDEQLKHAEMKYQLSFKVPVWKDIYNYPTTLYLAYTQLSYWQSYNHSAFFRETDYEPELFVANKIDFPVIKNWQVNFLNIGATHQSNGNGGELERSWNRIYIEAISSTGNWLVSAKPWYIVNDGGLTNHNPDIASYLGYGRLLVSYKYNQHVFSVLTHNIIESGGRRATAEFTWSVPMTPYIKAYAQVFSGYGQSLIEYNHRTNSVGVGVAFGDWMS